MTSTGGKNPLQSQSNLAFSTALALLGFLDVITIQGCRGLEQVFAKMRIAVTRDWQRFPAVDSNLGSDRGTIDLSH